MFNFLRGQRPDITPAQLAAMLVAGVPIVANLLGAFGLFSLSGVQQDALSDAITWGGVIGGLLIGGDVGLRAARNAATAKTDAAVATASAVAAAAPVTPAHINVDVDAETITDDELPDDETELSDPVAASIAAELEAKPEQTE